MEEQVKSLSQPLIDSTKREAPAGLGLQWSDVNLLVDEGKKQILNQCYGQVKRGELLGIVGSSGSGKTSLLNLLAYRLEPTCKRSGTVMFDGETIANRKEMKKISSFVSQTDNFHPNLTPRCNP